MIDRKELGRRLANHRRRQNLTQDDVARQVGITASGLASIESGRTDVPFSRLQSLSEALNTPVRDILFGQYGVGSVYQGPVGSSPLNWLPKPTEPSYAAPEVRALDDYIRALQRELRTATDQAGTLQAIEYSVKLALEEYALNPQQLDQRLIEQINDPKAVRLSDAETRTVRKLAHLVLDVLYDEYRTRNETT